MPGRPLWILTDVAPYQTGPAGVHGVLPQAQGALRQLAGLAGLDAPALRGPSDLDPEALAGGGVLALFTIGETGFDDLQRQAIMASWRAKRLGVLGLHSATDACRGWEDYGALLGGRFAGHPWTQDFEVAVTNANHPATSHLGPRFSWHDEVYLFDAVAPGAQILLTVADPSTLNPSPSAPTLPLAWCLEDPGRTFYCALGHFPSAWETPGFLELVAGGLAWLLQGLRQ